MLKKGLLLAITVFISLLAIQGFASTSKVKNRTIVYYFHGNYRCSSCTTIETLTKKAIEEGFKKELGSGGVELKIINIEKKENKHFIYDYKLTNRSVVAVNFKDGKEKEWKNLNKVWQLLRDDKAFVEYIQKEIKTYL